MEKNVWKGLAVVFIILFIIENMFFIWAYFSLEAEEDKINDCLYNICSEYPDAEFFEDVCYCYDYDVIGDLVVVKTEFMK